MESSRNNTKVLDKHFRWVNRFTLVNRELYEYDKEKNGYINALLNQKFDTLEQAIGAYQVASSPIY